MSKMKTKIFCLVSPAILLLTTVLFMVFNMPYIDAVDSIGSLGVSVLLFAGALIFQIYAIKDDSELGAAAVGLAIVCVLLLVIPVRGFAVSQKLANPVQKFNVELLEYKQEHLYGDTFVECELEFINETGVDLAGVTGTLSFFENDNLVANYEIFAKGNSENGFSNVPMVVTYQIEDARLLSIEESDLTIIYTFKSFRAGMNDYSCDPVEVKLK